MLFHERKLDSIDYAVDASRTLDLPRNNVYRALVLKLSGTYTTTATAPTGPKDNNPMRLIKRIEVVANGKDVIKSIPFRFLKWLNKVDFGTTPQITAVGSSASTAYPFEATLILPFAFTRARRPIDGALDARNLSTLDLRVLWGNTTDFHSTPNSAALSNTKLEVSSMEYINPPADFKAFLNKHTEIQKEVTASSINLQERVPVDRIYRRFLLYTEANDAANNDVLNNIQLKSGTFVFKDVNADVLQAMGKSLFSIETLDTGVYMIEMVSDGMLSEALNSAGMSSLEFVFDVTKQSGTNYIYIYPEVVEGI